MPDATTFAFTVILVILAGCAPEPDPLPWQKPATSQENTRITYSNCRRQANKEVRDMMASDLNALTDNPVGGPADADASLEYLQRERLAAKERELRTDVIERCMRENGFAYRS